MPARRKYSEYLCKDLPAAVWASQNRRARARKRMALLPDRDIARRTLTDELQQYLNGGSAHGES